MVSKHFPDVMFAHKEWYFASRLNWFDSIQEENSTDLEMLPYPL